MTKAVKRVNQMSIERAVVLASYKQQWRTAPAQQSVTSVKKHVVLIALQIK